MTWQVHAANNSQSSNSHIFSNIKAVKTCEINLRKIARLKLLRSRKKLWGSCSKTRKKSKKRRKHIFPLKRDCVKVFKKSMQQHLHVCMLLLLYCAAKNEMRWEVNCLWINLQFPRKKIEEEASYVLLIRVNKKKKSCLAGNK